MKNILVFNCFVVSMLLFSSCSKKSPTEPNPTLSVSQTNLTIASDSGSTGTFEVTSNTDWSVSDDADWLTVSPESGSNNGTITATASSTNHSTSSRSATVTVRATGVSEQTVNVTQNGSPFVTVDIDGNNFKTVKIGDQWWMAENLKVTHYRNGDSIPNVTDNDQWENLSSGAYCVIYNDESNADTYGYLYNWYAVNDIRNIAPEGWHVPTDEDWKELEMYLGMSRSEADNTEWRGTDEGGKMKEAGTAHWKSPNISATNQSGFSALPGTFRYYNGNYQLIGYYCCFWSSTESSSGRAWSRNLDFNHSGVQRTSYAKLSGLSVRCVRD